MYINIRKLSFRKRFRTRKAVFGLQALIERCKDANCDAYNCFLAFENALKKIEQRKFEGILHNADMNDTDLYWPQKAIYM